MFVVGLSLSTNAETRGVTGMAGIMYPKEKEYQINLNRGLIKFDGFDPYSSFNTMYELENQSLEVKKTTTIFPIYLFFSVQNNFPCDFTEFTPAVFEFFANWKPF